MATGLLTGLVLCVLVFTVCGRVLTDNCDVPMACTNSVPATCYFPTSCHKAPVKMGGETLGKRQVDCTRPYMCDRCMPSMCYYYKECNKEPVLSNPLLFDRPTLGKRCDGNFGTLG